MMCEFKIITSITPQNIVCNFLVFGFVRVGRIREIRQEKTTGQKINTVEEKRKKVKI
jgi:hypothetical protein